MTFNRNDIQFVGRRLQQWVSRRRVVTRWRSERHSVGGTKRRHGETLARDADRKLLGDPAAEGTGDDPSWPAPVAETTPHVGPPPGLRVHRRAPATSPPCRR